MTIMPLCIHGHSMLVQFVVFFCQGLNLQLREGRGLKRLHYRSRHLFLNPVSLRDVLTGCFARSLYSQMQIWYIRYSLKFLPTQILMGCCITCSACLRFSRIGLWLRDDPKVNDESIWMAWLSIWFIFVSIALLHIFLHISLHIRYFFEFQTLFLHHLPALAGGGLGHFDGPPWLCAAGSTVTFHLILTAITAWCFSSAKPVDPELLRFLQWTFLISVCVCLCVCKKSLCVRWTSKRLVWLSTQSFRGHSNTETENMFRSSRHTVAKTPFTFGRCSMSRVC